MFKCKDSHALNDAETFSEKLKTMVMKNDKLT